MSLDTIMLHSLLRRQIGRTFGDEGPPECERCEAFIEAIDGAYREFDRDRELLERSLELSSEELVEANEAMRAVFAASPDLYIWLTPDGEVRRIQYGDSADAHNRTRARVGSQIADVPDPDVAALFMDACRRVGETGEMVCFDYELEVADGPRDYEARIFPLPTGELMAVIRNISDRKRAEEERFKQLAEHIEEVFWMTEPDKGIMLYVSPAYEVVWKRSVQSLYDQPLSFIEAIHPDDRDRVVAAMARQASGDYDEEYRVVQPDGSIRWIRDRAFPVRDSDGRVYRITGLAADITESKHYQAEIEALNNDLEARVAERTAELEEASESLRQAQKMEAVGRLAGGVAHDFNNLLAVILSYADLAIDALEPGEPAAADLSEIRNAAIRAADLTRQLLAFSRRQVLRPAALNINEIVRQTERLLNRLIGEHIDIDLDLADDLPPCLVDPGQMGQILMNLGVNARDAMPRGGEIRISTTAVDIGPAWRGLEAGRYVRLELADTGVGVPPDVLPFVFEPFFTTKRDGNGTGLGLSTVFGIVAQSGGRVDLESEEGRGTRVIIHLPAADRHARAEPGDEPRGSLKGTETVLLVEDDSSLRALGERLLQAQGYRVVAAADGEAALTAVKDAGVSVDLLLTDVVMPRMGGRELCERLGAAQPGLRTLFMTGYTDDEVVRHGVAEGRADLLHKPFTPRELLSRVRAALRHA